MAATAFHLPPLSFRAKAAFATGDVVDGVLNYGVLVFVFYYLTAVCGLSGSVAGAILAISTVTDAVMDPLIGSISDNTRTRWGRRLPFMFAAAIPMVVAYGLLFSLPALPGNWLALYACVVLLVLRFSTSFFFLPYIALGAEFSTDYTERSVLFAYRVFLNCIGNITLLVLGYVVFMKGREGLLDRAAYAGFGWTCAAIALVAALTSAGAVLALRGRLRKLPAPERAGPGRLVFEATEVMKNRSFWILFLCVLMFWTSAGIVLTLGIHANLYFWRLPQEVIAALPFANIVGYMAAVPVATRLLLKFEKRDVALMALAITFATLLVPAPLQIAGLMPQGQALYAILGVLAFLGGFAGTCAVVPLGSMMADATDEHELKFGSRREGLYFAGLTLSVKAAAGLGGLFAGIALDLIGFPQNVAALGAAGPPAEVVARLGMVHGPVAGLVGILGAIVVMGYRIDKARLGRIQAELAERIAATSP